MRSLNLNPTDAELQDMVYRVSSCLFFFFFTKLFYVFRLMRLIATVTVILIFLNFCPCYPGNKAGNSSVNREYNFVEC